ncbi:MAG: FAD-binding oxidoreductase [Candidatus Thorarchaeota archaeon]|nr:FAD-binding oxidoreductase [Candidatus Thorarchaeota archaeon]
MITKKQKQNLADIVGEDYFSSEKFMTDIYSSDIAALPGIVNDVINPQAEAVAQPTTTEIVSNLLKYCKQHNIPVVPRGHGTSGYGGALPTRGGLVVEMTRLNEIHHIDRDNMTVEVGSGIIWGKLIEDLEDEGLAVAAYPSSAPSSTVAGWVAAGGSGIGSTKYGGISEQVVDLEVVLPDGEVIRTKDTSEEVFKIETGKKVFKGDDNFHWEVSDNVPYSADSTQLFVDSNGTLGIITKVLLKIIPLRNIRPITASFRSQNLMAGALLDILEATRPFYLHFITDKFYRMLRKVDQAPPTTGEFIISCAFEGSDDEIETEIEKLKHIVSRYSGTVESMEVADHEWDERFYPMRIKRLGPSLAPSEVYVPLENLDGYLNHVNKHFKAEEFALEGAITDRGEVAVLTWFPDDERRRISFLTGWYRSLDVINIGLKHGGRAYSIGMWNAAHSRSYYGKDNYAKMSALKRKKDKKGYLNSHKVFPGPLVLSTRLNLLIMVIAGIVAPIVIWLAGILVPSIIQAYVPWVVVNNLPSFLIWFVVGLLVGFIVTEFANLIPISVVLSIGTPFLRFFRKIFH